MEKKKKIITITLIAVIIIVLLLIFVQCQGSGGNTVADPTKESVQLGGKPTEEPTETTMGTESVEPTEVGSDSAAASTAMEVTEPAPSTKATEPQATTAPKATEPASSTKATEPQATTAPKATEPAPTDPKATEPAPSTKATEPQATTTPKTTEPAPTEPAPTTKPTQPGPTTSVHTHSYEVTKTVAAACETDGYTVYTCSCGDSYTETIPATGHDWVLTGNTSEEGYRIDYEKCRCGFPMIDLCSVETFGGKEFDAEEFLRLLDAEYSDGFVLIWRGNEDVSYDVHDSWFAQYVDLDDFYLYDMSKVDLGQFVGKNYYLDNRTIVYTSSLDFTSEVNGYKTIHEDGTIDYVTINTELVYFAWELHQSHYDDLFGDFGENGHYSFGNSSKTLKTKLIENIYTCANCGEVKTELPSIYDGYDDPIYGLAKGALQELPGASNRS